MSEEVDVTAFSTHNDYEGAEAASRTGIVLDAQEKWLQPWYPTSQERTQTREFLIVPSGPDQARDFLAEATVGMAQRMDHRPDETSGGEQRCVSIARALVPEPKHLLADEPTGELDTVTGAGILTMLRTIADAGTTVVMATHDPKAIEFVDTAYFVESGALHLPDRDELTLWLAEGTAFDTTKTARDSPER